MASRSRGCRTTTVPENVTIMKKMLLLFGAALLVLSGCVRDTKNQKHTSGVPPHREYKPLEEYNLSLELSGNRTLKAGGKGRIEFILTNRDTKPVQLPDWYAHEEDNIVVYCQPWLPGMKDPDPDAWIAIDFDLHKPPFRYPLELLAGNRVAVAKHLPFVEKLSVTPGKERRYFIKAALTLTTVKVTSPVAAVAIR